MGKLGAKGARQHRGASIASDILAVEQEAKGLLDGLLKTGKGR